MSNQIAAIVKAHNRDIARRKEIKLRKHLNADALFSTMKTEFDKIEDHRPGNIQHALGDTTDVRVCHVFSKESFIVGL